MNVYLIDVLFQLHKSNGHRWRACKKSTTPVFTYQSKIEETKPSLCKHLIGKESKKIIGSKRSGIVHKRDRN